MKQIQQIAAYARQKFTVPYLNDVITVSLYYSLQQRGWFITELTYGSFTLNGLRVCISANMLRQWKNLLPFGLACFSTSSREPTLIEDFSSGAASLYLMSAAEVEEYEAYLNA